MNRILVKNDKTKTKVNNSTLVSSQETMGKSDMNFKTYFMSTKNPNISKEQIVEILKRAKKDYGETFKELSKE